MWPGLPHWAHAQSDSAPFLTVSRTGQHMSATVSLYSLAIASTS